MLKETLPPSTFKLADHVQGDQVVVQFRFLHFAECCQYLFFCGFDLSFVILPINYSSERDARSICTVVEAFTFENVRLWTIASAQCEMLCSRCFGGLGGFLCLAGFVFAGGIFRTDAGVIRSGLEQFVQVEHVAVVGCDLVIVIHLDRVERAVLGAETAVHADVGIDVELSRLRDGLAGLGVVRAHDPDALRRADLRANTAGGAAHSFLAVFSLVIDQEGNIAELFGSGQFLFRVLDGEDTARVLAGAVGDPFGSVIALLAAGKSAEEPDSIFRYTCSKSVSR